MFFSSKYDDNLAETRNLVPIFFEERLLGYVHPTFVQAGLHSDATKSIGGPYRLYEDTKEEIFEALIAPFLSDEWEREENLAYVKRCYDNGDLPAYQAKHLEFHFNQTRDGHLKSIEVLFFVESCD